MSKIEFLILCLFTNSLHIPPCIYLRLSIIQSVGGWGRERSIDLHTAWYCLRMTEWQFGEFAHEGMNPRRVLLMVTSHRYRIVPGGWVNVDVRSLRCAIVWGWIGIGFCFRDKRQLCSVDKHDLMDNGRQSGRGGGRGLGGHGSVIVVEAIQGR